ncbi:MAG: Arginine repressor [Pelotomaculum sp. PtaU1.Bin035]|nr:MAG: Arginine repressor [Pelotomaculum sp. PtaU1.Bin035]
MGNSDQNSDEIQISGTEEDLMEYGSADKLLRQSVLVGLVAKGKFRDQDELLNALKEKGFAVKQPTLSRDLKALGIFKVRGKYELSPEAKRRQDMERLRHRLSEFGAEKPLPVSTVAIKTGPGFARSAGKMLEDFFGEDIIGSIAGDDIVILAVRRGKREKGKSFASDVVEKITGLLEGES